MKQKPIIKLFSKENVRVHVTDFELLKISFYGCDARFEYEVRDKEIDTLLYTDYDTIEYAFMGVDDSEEIYYFLEEKGIDFSAEYDDDYDKLPAEIRKEFEQYELSHYNDIYHEYFFDGGSDVQDVICEKLLDNLYPSSGDIYVICGDKVSWIDITSDYFGIHPQSDEIVINRVYNMDNEDWIYEVEGVYFELSMIYSQPRQHTLLFYERDEDSRYVITEDDITEGAFPDYDGQAGDELYNYYAI